VIAYLSGKYTGDVDANIAKAREAAIELWERGYTVVCPHLNTAHFEQDCKIPYERYIEGDLEILSRCDLIVMLPNYEESKGAIGELEFARQRGILVSHYSEIMDFY
jgi:hypothetical protein